MKATSARMLVLMAMSILVSVTTSGQDHPGRPEAETIEVVTKRWHAQFADGHRESYVSLLEIVIQPRGSSSGCRLEYHSGFIHTVRMNSAIVHGMASVVERRVLDARSAELQSPCDLTRLAKAAWPIKDRLIADRRAMAERAFGAFIESVKQRCITFEQRCTVDVND